MLVRSTTNQINYNNYQPQKVNKNTSFKGKLGEKVLKEIPPLSVKSEKETAEILKKLGIGFLGLVSLSKLKDILDTYTTKLHGSEIHVSCLQDENKNLRKEMDQTTQKVEERNKEIDKKIAEANQKLDERSQKLNIIETSFNERSAKKSKELDEREAELNKRVEDVEFIEDMYKEKALKNAEALYQDRMANVEKMEDDLRALYGKEAPENAEIRGEGEQMVAVAAIINDKKYQLKNVPPSAPIEITKALQNKEGVIYPEAFTFLRRILSVQNNCTISDLPSAIRLVKDEKGNINPAEAAKFIAVCSVGGNFKSNISEFLRTMTDKQFKMLGLKYTVGAIKAKDVLDKIGVRSELSDDGMITLTSEYRIDNDDAIIIDSFGLSEDDIFKYVKSANGDVSLYNSELTNLGSLKYINKNLYIGNNLRNLGDLKIVNGTVHLRDSQLTKKDFANVQVDNFY